MLAKSLLRNNVVLSFARRCSNKATTSSTSSSQLSEVPGLSQNVMKLTSEKVGPGVAADKNGPYKAPEFFGYHDMSFFEAEVEMHKYRIPQPSALKK